MNGLDGVLEGFEAALALERELGVRAVPLDRTLLSPPAPNPLKPLKLFKPLNPFKPLKPLKPLKPPSSTSSSFMTGRCRRRASI